MSSWLFDYLMDWPDVLPIYILQVTHSQCMSWTDLLRKSVETTGKLRNASEQHALSNCILSNSSHILIRTHDVHVITRSWDPRTTINFTINKMQSCLRDCNLYQCQLNIQRLYHIKLLRCVTPVLLNIIAKDLNISKIFYYISKYISEHKQERYLWYVRRYIFEFILCPIIVANSIIIYVFKNRELENIIIQVCSLSKEMKQIH